MTTLAAMRPAYGQALVDLGRAREDVVVLSADVSNSDFSWMFAEAFPERFLNVGIAEQSLVDVAVGLAYTGYVPFANTFAFLFATRALEMVRTHCCYGGAPVKLMGAYCGVSDSFDGPTHNAITDIAIMRALPGMTIVSPADTVAVAKLLPQVADWPGPVYMRLNRNEVPVLFDDGYAPEIGKAMTSSRGRRHAGRERGSCSPLPRGGGGAGRRGHRGRASWRSTPSSRWTRRLSSRPPARPGRS